MPEESTVKQEQMTCEEDWPVGKKAAFFTLTVIILVHPVKEYFAS